MTGISDQTGQRAAAGSAAVVQPPLAATLAFEVYLKRGYFCVAAQNAVAARYAATQIFNPLNSNVDVYIPNINGINSAGNVIWRITGNDEPNGSAPSSFSVAPLRRGSLLASSLAVYGFNLGNNSASSEYGRVNVGSTVPVGSTLLVGNEVIILQPGTGIQIEQETVNTGLTIEFPFIEVPVTL